MSKRRKANIEEIEVARIPTKPTKSNLRVGKPQKKIVKTAMGNKFAYGGGGMSGALGGLGGNTAMGSGGNFYSPELSTDFLELPQSLDEKRNFYRFFYANHEYVGQAIDLHTELPLSKTRLRMPPEATNLSLAKEAFAFGEEWAERIGLWPRLIEISHDYWKLGEAFVFIEDDSPDMPEDVRYEKQRTLLENGEAVEELLERPDADERHIKWQKKNYKGWTDIKTIPPEQMHMESFFGSKEKIFELVPDSKTKKIIEQAAYGDPEAERVVSSMSKDIVEPILAGENIPLNTDPDAGSFIAYLPRKRSGYEERGHSLIERCLRTLIHEDKLRQANASIASRHMTPIRIVWVEDGSAGDVEDLREQVDLALQDPDFSIITNYQVNWEEMGANDRLLDLSSEYDRINQRLYAGLGVTESLLTGESSYGGDRLPLSIINDRYLLFREIIQDFVDKKILEPMCRRMGFIEEDSYGRERVLYPRLSFTRLALRDNQETFDSLFNLYQKGSLPVEYILDLLNIDPERAYIKLKNDLWTLKDATMNELMRSVLSDVGRKIAEESNVVDHLAEELGLEMKPPPEEEGAGGGMGRFAHENPPGRRRRSK